MASNRHGFGLLIAAHGERGGGGRNENISRLVEELAARDVAPQVSYGLIKGMPTISSALDALLASEIFVYPLLLADGYFTQTILPRSMEEAALRRAGRSVKILPALGLDPALAELIAVKAAFVAQANGFAVNQTTLVLLAHGSSHDPASRSATRELAARANISGDFHAVRVAFLEESPSLKESASEVSGPVVIVGLFSGDGLHGGDDVTRLVTELRRKYTVYAGNVGSFMELADLVAATVGRALNLPNSNCSSLQPCGHKSLQNIGK